MNRFASLRVEQKLGIKNLLYEEFDGKCSYCGTFLNSHNFSIEHFYPPKSYPEKDIDMDNLLPACMFCNAAKGSKFPVDEEGEPLLLNPRIDKYSEHITINPDGFAVGLTKRGILTIELLKLNRPRLVEERKIKYLQEKYEENVKSIPTEYFSNFTKSLNSIRKLNEIRLNEPEQKYLKICCMLMSLPVWKHTYQMLLCLQ